MKTFPLPIILACLACASTASGADLSKINRAIVKEPAYHSKPRYCLLVFGPEAKTRVWLVQDGDTLYVDRNGNGDLTEPGKKIQAEKRDDEDSSYIFNIGAIIDGNCLHKELQLIVAKLDGLAEWDETVRAFLAKNPQGRGYRLSVELEMPGWKGAMPEGRVRQRTSLLDRNGLLQFADRPKEAPIIHFGGPWQVTLYGQHELTIDREADVVLGVGTPGIGPGTMAYINYDGVIPEHAYPTVDIAFPSIKANDAALLRLQPPRPGSGPKDGRRGQGQHRSAV
jgi:hypothetical protein